MSPRRTKWEVRYSLSDWQPDLSIEVEATDIRDAADKALLALSGNDKAHIWMIAENSELDEDLVDRLLKKPTIYK